MPLKQFKISGTSLPEVLMVLVVASILLGIATPNWLGWHRKTLLQTAQDEALQAMRQAQLRAIQTRQSWQIGFRKIEDRTEWAIYPTHTAPTRWEVLTTGVQIALEDTSLPRNGQNFFVEFNARGQVMPPLGRLSLMTGSTDRRRRCVFVSTVLGAMRKAADRDCMSPRK